MASIDELVFGTRLFWLGLVLVPFTALISDVVYKIIKKSCFRSLSDEHAFGMRKFAAGIMKKTRRQRDQDPPHLAANSRPSSLSDSYGTI